jgi:hypothetical protein
MIDHATEAPRLPASKTVVALDPGRTSGVVTAQVTREGALDIEYFQEITFTPNELYRYLVGRNPDALVVERFTYRPKHGTESGLDLYPCYLIGVCYLYVEQRANCTLVQQEASEGKSGHYGKDETLSELGVYYKGGKGHARDATRHLLHWFYEGSGYHYNHNGVLSKGFTKEAQTEKQKHPKRTGKRNTGDIEF